MFVFKARILIALVYKMHKAFSVLEVFHSLYELLWLVHWIDLRLCLGEWVGGGVVGMVYGLTSVRGIQSPRSPAVFGVVVDKHIVRDR